MRNYTMRSRFLVLAACVYLLGVGQLKLIDHYGYGETAIRGSSTSRTTATGSTDEIWNKASLDEKPGPVHDDDCPAMALLVQGTNSWFSMWYNILENHKYPCKVTLFFAAYDQEVDHEGCKQNENCHTPYIPGTTWTQGRNKLAELVYEDEQQSGRQYTYWIFSDDDTKIEWRHEGTPDKETGRNNRSYSNVPQAEAWTRFLQSMADVAVPAKTPAVVAGFFSQTADSPYPYMMTDSYDAFLNAFHRSSVPYLLPYPHLRKGFSQWMSQAAHFWVMERCFTEGALAFTEMYATNNAQRDYIRGLNLKQHATILRDNYEPYFNQTKYPDSEPVKAQFKLKHHVPDAESVKPLSEVSRNGVETYCAPFKKRHEDWVASFTADQTGKALIL